MNTVVYVLIAFVLSSFLWLLFIFKLKMNHTRVLSVENDKQASLSQRLAISETVSSRFVELESDYKRLKDDEVNFLISNETNKSITAELGSVKTLNMDLSSEVNDLQLELVELKSTLKNTLENHAEKVKILAEAKENMSEAFELMAKKIFTEQTKEMSEVSKEKIGDLLKPLQDKLEGFEKQVKDNTESSITRAATMTQELKRLQELNQQVSTEATNLTKALKGESKTQGCWGEMILERILESAGLTKNIEFTVQESFSDESAARKQPDAIIKLPEDKQIIVDSKVSIRAYEQYCNVNDSGKEAQLSKAHCTAIQNHVKELSNKNYQALEGINCVDMVLMFIPIEPALGLALQECPSLFEDAMRKNVILVTPSTLLATMRTVAYIWRHENQNKNALKIAEEGGKFYDKLVGFVEDMDKLGNQLDTTAKTYKASMNKLSQGTGNLVKRAEDIRKLGVMSNKRLNKKIVDQSNLSVLEG
ncbi:MAG: DNA recombination protein RmuC [Lentisphaeria bacterium]|nr:DNA recombination protein RmuC [Lentisphaeria bacterium]